MDGQLNEAVWTVGTWQNIANVTVPTNTMSATGKFQAHWDAANLYIGLVMTKSPAALYTGTAGALWSSDAFEIYFDMNHDKSATYNTSNDFHYTFGYGTAAPDVSAGTSTTGLVYAWYNTGTGWSAEISIPWTALGVTPAQGAVYGFDAAADVASASGTRNCQLTWHSTTATNYQDTSQFGDLTLGAACPYMSPTRTPTASAFTPTLTFTVAAVRGATTPWIEVEAENATQVTGALIGPSRTVGQMAAEASGRKAVQLNATGQFVKFTTTSNCNAIVVRYSIPDAAGGGGINATLSLYVGGTHNQDLNLTSKYGWDYGGWGYPYNENPSGGTPVHVFDEARAMIGETAAGTAITLQKDATDTAAWYVIDLIDLEEVAPALAQPGNSYSVMSYGALGNGANDDTTAIQNCINAAQPAGKIVWIPSGTYKLTGSLNVPAVSIQGAGMWYTTLHETSDVGVLNLNLTNASAYVGDLSILGEVTNRNDAVGDNGINGHGGTNSTVKNVWIEHTKCGWWVGNTGSVTSGLTITGCRVRDTYADGVNFCNGTSNSTITQCHFRNTGDDSLASWSPTGGGVNTNNIFKFNTVQIPWRANCFAIYGGNSNKIEDNLGSDTLDYPGILIAQEFTSNGFSGTTSVQRNTLTRCGGPYGGTNQGALKFSAVQGGISGILAADCTLNDSTYSGIFFSGNNAINATLTNMAITTTGTYGMQVTAGTSGTENCTSVVVTGAPSGGLLNSGSATFNKISGNSGW